MEKLTDGWRTRTRDRHVQTHDRVHLITPRTFRCSLYAGKRKIHISLVYPHGYLSGPVTDFDQLQEYKKQLREDGTSS